MTRLAALDAVSVRHGDVWALSELSLAVEEGELLVVVGPSGCGKSTLLRVMSGLQAPTSGRFHLAGVDVTQTPPHLRDVNQVFQSYALFPHLSVLDNVQFGPRMKGLPRREQRARADEALGLVALTGMEARRPESLSGGERQRVALARALACRPRLLLLDEPLSALDAALRSRVRAELKSLQRRLGTTFVVVTHDQDEALSMGDRLALLRGGRLEQLGPTREVYDRPATRFSASFLGAANVLERDEARALGVDADGPVAVRREHVALGDGPLAASVVAVGYGGATAEITLRVGEVRLTALVPGDAAPTVGSEVAVRVERVAPLGR